MMVKKFNIDTGLNSVSMAPSSQQAYGVAGSAANFTRVGVAGHSMGGGSAGYLASRINATARYGVHAYVGMHGTPVSKEAGLELTEPRVRSAEEDIDGRWSVAWTMGGSRYRHISSGLNSIAVI